VGTFILWLFAALKPFGGRELDVPLQFVGTSILGGDHMQIFILILFFIVMTVLVPPSAPFWILAAIYLAFKKAYDSFEDK